MGRIFQGIACREAGMDADSTSRDNLYLQLYLKRLSGDDSDELQEWLFGRLKSKGWLAPLLLRLDMLADLYTEREKQDRLLDLGMRLFTLIDAEHAGDADAANQLAAIDKIISPHVFNLSKSNIETLVTSFHTTPSLARASAVRELMAELSTVVRGRGGARNVCAARIELNPEESKSETYKLASRYWPRKGSPTLKSLAIRVYLGQLEAEEGVVVTEREILTDLRKMAEWEQGLTDEKRRLYDVSYAFIYNGVNGTIRLPVVRHSEGWKARRQPKGDKLSHDFTG
jgi:hypothetical protein